MAPRARFCPPQYAIAPLARSANSKSDGKILFPVIRDRSLRSLKQCAFLTWWIIILLSLPLSAQDLPAGTTLEARLSMATGSRISHAGDRIEATIIAPASVGGRILIPDGSAVSGTIENVNPIGWGLKHTTATIGYNFNALRLTNGETILIKSEVVDVETAKERVDFTGTVQGIHPIASLSSTLDFAAVPFAAVHRQRSNARIRQDLQQAEVQAQSGMSQTQWEH
jgi:hypothetical protein